MGRTETAELQRHPSTLGLERFRHHLRQLPHLAYRETEAHNNNALFTSGLKAKSQKFNKKSVLGATG